MVFQIVIKNNVMKNNNDIKIRDQELLTNLFYNTSVVNPVILKKINMKIKVNILLETTIVVDTIKITTHTITTDIETLTDIEATVEIIRKIIIDLILDKDITIDLQVQTHLDPEMTTIIKADNSIQMSI